MSSEQSEKYIFIEYLRGICTLQVLILHIVICFYPVVFYGNESTWTEVESRYFIENIIGKTPLFSLINGSFAVYVFWLISGFLIASKVEISDSILNCLKKCVLKTEFYIITVFLSLVLSYAVLKLRINANIVVGNLLHNGALLGYLYPNGVKGIESLLKDLVSVFYRSSSYYNVTLWFMGKALWCMIFAYVYCIVYKNLISKTKIYVQVFAIAVVGLALLFFRNYSLISTFLGISFFYFLKSSSHFLDKIYKYIGMPLLIIGFMCAGYPQNHDQAKLFYDIFPDIPYELYYLLGAISVFSATYFIGLHKSYKSKIIGMISKISYEVYLIHFPIYMTLGLNVFYFLFSKMNCEYIFSVIITSVSELSIVFLFSYVIHKYLTPIIKKTDIIKLVIMFSDFS